jgi:plastocyanin
MSIRAGLLAVGAVIVVFNLVGCGGSSNEGQSSTASAPAASSPGTTTTSSPAAITAPSTTQSGLSVDVTIADHVAKPMNASYQASVGQPITFRVTSDAEDELHVHSVPEHSFDVKAAPDQTFTFTVDVPGRVEVELHHLDVVVATIDVR